MKHKTQDPKFYIENNQLVGQSGPVPDDEPLFIFRARDRYAVRILMEYMHHILGRTDDSHAAAVAQRIADFTKFASEHKDRMKIPDTDLRALHDGNPATEKGNQQ